MALSKTTQDHDEIRQWAEKRGAKPAEVAATAGKGKGVSATGILRLEFPGAPHANDAALQEIEWDEFFEKFDASGLEFLYEEKTAKGEQSNFNKLIYPEVGTPAAKKNARKAPAKKSAAKGSAKTATKGAAKTAAKSASKTASKSAGTKTSGKTAAKKIGSKAASEDAPAKKTAAKKTDYSKVPPTFSSQVL